MDDLAISSQERADAFARLGLTSNAKDYALERIVRITARATGMQCAHLSTIVGETQFNLVNFGEIEQAVPAESTPCCIVEATGESFTSVDVLAGAELQDAMSEMASNTRAFLCAPVLDTSMQPIGTLWAYHSEQVDLDISLAQQSMNDCVRMVEDLVAARHHATKDALTGLYNRRFFDEQIDREWQRALRQQVPISVLVLDIDYFKHYNDSCGHLAGDEVIKTVAGILIAEVRRASDTLCRFGGEEFIVFMPQTTLESAKRLAERIRAEVEDATIPHPGHPHGPTHVVTVSVGVATADDLDSKTSASVIELLRNADEMLYQAKETGRNTVCY